MTNTTQDRPTRSAAFVERLAGLERAQLAMLKRAAGETIAHARLAAPVFYRLYYGAEDDRNEEVYFLVATLYAVNPRSLSGNFGVTMRRIVQAAAAPDAIDRRMSILLDSEFDLVDGFRPGGGELAYRLRQCVRLAASKEVGVDWPRLADDLCYWTHPSRRIQKAWAKAHFGKNTDTQEATGLPAKGS